MGLPEQIELIGFLEQLILQGWHTMSYCWQRVIELVDLLLTLCILIPLALLDLIDLVLLPVKLLLVLFLDWLELLIKIVIVRFQLVLFLPQVFYDGLKFVILFLELTDGLWWITGGAGIIITENCCNLDLLALLRGVPLLFSTILLVFLLFFLLLLWNRYW